MSSLAEKIPRSSLVDYMKIRHHIQDPSYTRLLTQAEQEIESSPSASSSEDQYLNLMNIASEAVEYDPSIPSQNKQFLRQIMNDTDIKLAIKEIKEAQHRTIRYIKQLRHVYKHKRVRKSMKVMHDFAVFLALLCRVQRRYMGYNLQYSPKQAHILQNHLLRLRKWFQHVLQFMVNRYSSFPYATQTDAKFLMKHLKQTIQCLNQWLYSTGYSYTDNGDETRWSRFWKWLRGSK